MKKTITKIAAVLLLVMCLFTTGCTVNSCINCAEVKCKGCVACSLEQVGCIGDFNVCADAFMGEDCSDACNVALYYNAAECVRVCDHTDCSLCWDYTKGMDIIDEGDYTVYWSGNPKFIDGLNNYYKVDLKVSLETTVPIKDVSILFNVTDSNGNRLNNVLLYIDDKVVGKKHKFGSSNVVLTFKYADNDRVGITSDEYEIFVDVIAVYGKY